VRAPSDPRRYVAFRAFGTARLLLRAQASLEDTEGALAAGQYEAAAINARLTVQVCLSIRGMAHEGELELLLGDTTFDPFLGVELDEVAQGLALANEGIDIDARSGPAWFRRLRQFYDLTEEQLGYDAQLPVLRSPAGMFAGLRLARTWAPLVEALGMPPLLPKEWIKEARTGA
jgi:hypothetical protein